MKRIIHRILFKNYKPVQYVSLGIPPGQIRERVVLEYADNRIDVSDRHWILCQTPPIIGIYLHEKESLPDNGRLRILIEENKSADIFIRRIQAICSKGGHLALYKVSHVSCYQLPLLHRLLLQFHFYFKRKNKVTFKNIRKLCALYSYPRKVIVTSFKDESGYNLFPMDFQGYIPGSNLYVLGLRHSNITLPKILESKSFVVADASVEHVQAVYALGEHHSSHPPPLHKLPFSVIKSKLYQFYLPEFVSSYKELRIINHMDLGSHMLLIGEVMHSQSLTEGNDCLHHLHFIQFLERDRLMNHQK